MSGGVRNAIVGFFIGMLVGGAIMKSAHPRFGRHGTTPEKRHERIVSKLTSKLDLTPEQREAVSGILAEGRTKVDVVMGDVRPQINEIREETSSRIKVLLTPEQQEKFEKLNEKMKKRWKKRRSRH